MSLRFFDHGQRSISDATNLIIVATGVILMSIGEREVGVRWGA
jgi:hypothetical protein